MLKSENYDGTNKLNSRQSKKTIMNPLGGVYAKYQVKLKNAAEPIFCEAEPNGKKKQSKQKLKIK